MTIIDDAPRVMSTDVPDDEIVPFRDLGLPDSIVHRLESQGKHNAFPIQAAVIPDALAGRDVAGRAPTGSGKTLAFGLPLVARLVDATPEAPVALVLAPTRELAEQIWPSSRLRRRPPATMPRRSTAASGTAPSARRSTAASTRRRLPRPARGPHPDAAHSTCATSPSSSSTKPTGWPTWASCPPCVASSSRRRSDRQVLLFSATLDGPVAKLVADFQHDPVRHEVGAKGPDVHAAQHLSGSSTATSASTPLPR